MVQKIQKLRRFLNIYNLELVIESHSQLLEQKTTAKFLRTKGVSHRNRKFFKQRQSEGKTGSFLKSVKWNEKNDTVHLTYEVVPTFEKTVKLVTKSGGQTRGDKYTNEVMFEKVSKYLGSKKEFKGLSKKEQIQVVSKLIKNAKTKVHSNDMSWFWQGGFEEASKKGYAIYEFPSGRAGKGIWKARHGGGIFSTKHFIEVLKTVPFVADEIAKGLRV